MTGSVQLARFVLIWCFLGRVSVIDSFRLLKLSFVLLSCCKSPMFRYLCAIEEPVTRQPEPPRICLIMSLGCFLLSFFLAFWLLFALRESCCWIQLKWDFWERIKNEKLWKANSIWKHCGRFTAVIKNRFHIKHSSGTSVPPSSNDNCATNKNTESPMTHKCTRSLKQGLFYISIHRVATLLPILLVRRGQLVPPRGRARCFAICRQKNPRCISSNRSCCQ